MKVLITGATGNVGLALLKALADQSSIEVVAGVRDMAHDKAHFPVLEGLECRLFDFEKAETFDTALQGIDLVFLLRPPHIADIPRYFAPLIQKIKDMGIAKVVLLSVQGAERSNIIPHRKIEKLILEHGLEYIFLRPSYFMENLTTTLLAEIKAHRTITLPSRQAQFNWVSVQDIGAMAAYLIAHFDSHKNQPLVISGRENLSFGDVVQRINHLTHAEIRYKSVNPLTYYFLKRREGQPRDKVMVMLVLHFLPVLQGPPQISDRFEAIMQRAPTSIDQFIADNRSFFLS
ncbi:NAD(P)H-binding protein [Salinispirillum sp. LH 10-3-1]|uniref:NAD(P)H-binding protein n=1 Tax=Salinispirillum sp. LH 10-3-1 TaxID=2952525 RepID=A0AB38YD13_9GAMM